MKPLRTSFFNFLMTSVNIRPERIVAHDEALSSRKDLEIIGEFACIGDFCAIDQIGMTGICRRNAVAISPIRTHHLDRSVAAAHSCCEH